MPPKNPPQNRPASPPSQGEPVWYEVAYAVMAPSTRVPSSPRFTRPDFSVRHSPSATNMKGVEPRNAPPIMANSTMKNGLSLICGCSCAVRRAGNLEYLETAIERFRHQQHHESESLQHQHGGVGQVHAPLYQPAGGDDTAEQNRDRNDGERIVAGQERHQDAGGATPRQHHPVGPA